MIKPKIHNIVCTANLKQKVDVAKLSEIPCGIYDEAIYRGICGYIKTPEMDGRVTIFTSGKMISLGCKSIKNATRQLQHAKFFLIQEKMIDEISLHPIIQNIVATVDVGKKISIEKVALKISNARYDPKSFPGVILKILNVNFLIFSSGKIVIVGAKSLEEVSSASSNLITKLKKFFI